MTRLDQTGLYYVTADEYNFLHHMIGSGPQYIGLNLRRPHVKFDLYFLTYIEPGTETHSVLGPESFWNPDIDIVATMSALAYTKPKDHFGACLCIRCNEPCDDPDDLIPKGLTDKSFQRMKRMAEFARVVQNIIDFDLVAFISAWRASEEALREHRKLVLKLGQLLHEDMFDHDMTKTSLVRVALGVMWHYKSDKGVLPEEYRMKALACVHAGHLELEDHHPESVYKGEFEEVGARRLLVDRLSVHLQKDEKDDKGGWDIRPCFVPPEFRSEFVKLRNRFGDVDLYVVKK